MPQSKQFLRDLIVFQWVPGVSVIPCSGYSFGRADLTKVLLGVTNVFAWFRARVFSLAGLIASGPAWPSSFHVI